MSFEYALETVKLLDKFSRTLLHFRMSVRSIIGDLFKETLFRRRVDYVSSGGP